jgi:hypothetical protein
MPPGQCDRPGGLPAPVHGTHEERKEVNAMTSQTLPGRPLSIWQPVHLGLDEMGQKVDVTLAERNMLIGGEPGAGSPSPCSC